MFVNIAHYIRLEVRVIVKPLFKYIETITKSHFICILLRYNERYTAYSFIVFDRGPNKDFAPPEMINSSSPVKPSL